MGVFSRILSCFREKWYTVFMDLAKKHCVACKDGAPALESTVVEHYRKALPADWHVDDGRKLRKEFTFKDFRGAMKFVNTIADIAEAEGHHPDIAIFYNKVTIELWTHAAGGLTENDFILTAKIEALPHHAP